MRHWDERRACAGKAVVNSQGDLVIAPDLRHTATFAKAILAIGGSSETVVQAFRTVWREYRGSDLRVPTQAEVLSVLGLMRERPELRPPEIDATKIDHARYDEGKRLLEMLHEEEDRTFFRDPKASPDTLPFYTWWVLQCCGKYLSESEDNKLRGVFERILDGVRSTEVRDDQGTWFPLVLGAEEAVGRLAMTAALPHALFEIKPDLEEDLLIRCLNFLLTRLLDRKRPSRDFPFLYAYSLSLLGKAARDGVLSKLDAVS